MATKDKADTAGSGQYAVWNDTLGQYVSGVSNKADADKALATFKDDGGTINGVPTKDHDLEVREV